MFACETFITVPWNVETFLALSARITPAPSHALFSARVLRRKAKEWGNSDFITKDSREERPTFDDKIN